jgi:AcrR family transcriptional regulator
VASHIERRVPKFRRRAEARPDEVLDAAQALFIDQGYAATRVEDIARRAGISKGAVYLYFPSKQAIIEGLVRRTVMPIAASALENAQNFQGHPRMLVVAISAMLADRLGDPQVLAIPRLIMRELVNFPELAEMYRREVLDRAIPVFVGVIRRGIEQGYLRPVDPELTVRSVVGPLIAHLMLAELFGIVPEGGLAFDRLFENHITILFDGMSVPEGTEHD